LAEKLPAFRGGFVKTLQSIRDYQRKRSDELYAETRAPAGVDISYSGFRLMELFPAEEYDRLISGLRKLFPAQRYGRDEIDRLGTNVPNLFSGGWSSIGLLRREKSWLGTLQTRTIPDLPEEVSTIEVGTHKILPSAVVVAFDVRLTASATKRLKALHDRKYLPDVRFHRWTPWREHGWGRSESPPEWAMQDAILDWEEELRSRVERILRPYLAGFFSRSEGSRGRFPVIDLFTVIGLPSCEIGETRLQAASRWMESLALYERPFLVGTFVGKDLMFSWSKDSDERPAIPYRFIEIYSELPAGENDEAHRHFRLQESLDAALPYVCLLEAISRIRRQLETLRVRVYSSLAENSSFGRGLRKEMKLNDTIQKEVMFLSRFALELEDARPWLAHEIQLLRELTQPKARLEDKSFDLAEALPNALKFHLDRVRKHLDLVAKMFRDYVSRRSVAAMYRLQIQVLVLSIIATLATILGVLANWSELKGLFHFIAGH